MIWLLYLVDQWGRRILLMIGSAGGAVCMYYIGAYIAVADPESSSTHTVDAGGKSAGKSGPSINEFTSHSFSPVAFFYLWTIFYSPSWNGTPWVIGAEIFPQHVRTFTQACMAAGNWLFA